MSSVTGVNVSDFLIKISNFHYNNQDERICNITIDIVENKKYYIVLEYSALPSDEYDKVYLYYYLTFWRKTHFWGEQYDITEEYNMDKIIKRLKKIKLYDKFIIELQRKMLEIV